MDTHHKLDNMPEFLSTQELVTLGLYPSIDAAHTARLRRRSPDYLKCGRKILYPKSRLISFIEQHLRKGTTTDATTMSGE